MPIQDIVIVAAGGFGREVHQWIEDVNAADHRFNLLGFVDGDATLHGTAIHGLPVLGDLEWFDGRVGVAATIAVGAPRVKRLLAERLHRLGAPIASIIHPRAIVGRHHVRIGRGAIVCPAAILTTDIEVGDYVTLNLGLTVGHDSRIGDYATLAPGVHVSGHVTILEGCDLGSGAALVPGVTVGAWSIVGSGAVVSADLPANVTAVGVPAHVVKTREVGWHTR